MLCAIIKNQLYRGPRRSGKLHAQFGTVPCLLALVSSCLCTPPLPHDFFDIRPPSAARRIRCSHICSIKIDGTLPPSRAGGARGARGAGGAGVAGVAGGAGADGSRYHGGKAARSVTVSGKKGKLVLTEWYT